MRYVFQKTDSLENLDPRAFAGKILLLPNGECFQAVVGDELGGAKSFFKKLGIVALGAAGAIAAPFTGGLSLAASSALVGAIGAGGQIAAGLLGGAGGGGASGGQAKGLPAIQAAGAQVISQLAELKKKAASGEIPKADAYAAADKLVAALSDTTYFYQPKKGKDAEALAGFKTQAAQLAAEVKQTADATEAVLIGQSAQKKNGGFSNATGAGGSNLPFGLSIAEVIVGGAVIYFFTRR